MAIIENTTPRVNNKQQTQPSISIRETLELSTDKINVSEWAEHLHSEIHLKTDKRKLKIRLGHNDVLDIYNQTKKILKQ
ncbi:hypothetical protein SAMN04489761_0864 [Tenacibaculum sp. MAR_2009_124]|uniref:hypothetical protein n=1 Tax=Tenacibaculum sp. MAR_2009_124 TaxID=1250059 RepID=UPI000895BD42|nr:hypothetical protein [Tenacibaculum sp. MAR_2009_124]SEB46316.1 hypothetical protein SAMN04489761_0864 [Tenacibaculum sp. MAR_2009_124]